MLPDPRPTFVPARPGDLLAHVLAALGPALIWIPTMFGAAWIVGVRAQERECGFDWSCALPEIGVAFAGIAIGTVLVPLATLVAVLGLRHDGDRRLHRVVLRLCWFTPVVAGIAGWLVAINW